MALLLPEAVAQGDAAARAILERTVRELCLLASTVIERLELQRGRLALSGGVLKNDAYVTEGVKAQLGELYPELESFLLATSGCNRCRAHGACSRAGKLGRIAE